jgi:hypothetical protein
MERDEDAVRRSAYKFMLTDIKDLREVYKRTMNCVFSKMEELTSNFATERNFFLSKANDDELRIQELEENSVALERKFAAEKVFTD